MLKELLFAVIPSFMHISAVRESGTRGHRHAIAQHRAQAHHDSRDAVKADCTGGREGADFPGRVCSSLMIKYVLDVDIFDNDDDCVIQWLEFRLLSRVATAKNESIHMLSDSRGCKSKWVSGTLRKKH